MPAAAAAAAASAVARRPSAVPGPAVAARPVVFAAVVGGAGTAVVSAAMVGTAPAEPAPVRGAVRLGTRAWGVRARQRAGAGADSSARPRLVHGSRSPEARPAPARAPARCTSPDSGSGFAGLSNHSRLLRASRWPVPASARGPAYAAAAGRHGAEAGDGAPGRPAAAGGGHSRLNYRNNSLFLRVLGWVKGGKGGIKEGGGACLNERSTVPDSSEICVKVSDEKVNGKKGCNQHNCSSRLSDANEGKCS